MPEPLKTRSSSIDLGATVVVKREGDLQGQQGERPEDPERWLLSAGPLLSGTGPSFHQQQRFIITVQRWWYKSV